MLAEVFAFLITMLVAPIVTTTVSNLLSAAIADRCRRRALRRKRAEG